MKTSYLSRWLFSAALALLFVAVSGMSVTVLAQTANTGTVTGVVNDEKGGLVPGASVKIVNLGTNAERTATTSSDGVYEITQLVPGNYRLEVEAKGFSKYVQEPVVVSVLQRTTVNPELKVGGIGETVTVTGESAALVETTKTDVGGVVDQRRLENLPVNGRSFASLAILIPGATRLAALPAAISTSPLTVVTTKTTQSAAFFRISRWKEFRSLHSRPNAFQQRTAVRVVRCYQSSRRAALTHSTDRHSASSATMR
jgi:hypothetical protein